MVKTCFQKEPVYQNYSVEKLEDVNKLLPVDQAHQFLSSSLNSIFHFQKLVLRQQQDRTGKGPACAGFSGALSSLKPLKAFSIRQHINVKRYDFNIWGYYATY
jgi:hypothetical protein